MFIPVFGHNVCNVPNRFAGAAMPQGAYMMPLLPIPTTATAPSCATYTVKDVPIPFQHHYTLVNNAAALAVRSQQIFSSFESPFRFPHGMVQHSHAAAVNDILNLKSNCILPGRTAFPSRVQAFFEVENFVVRKVLVDQAFQHIHHSAVIGTYVWFESQSEWIFVNCPIDTMRHAIKYQAHRSHTPSSNFQEVVHRQVILEDWQRLVHKLIAVQKERAKRYSSCSRGRFVNKSSFKANESSSWVSVKDTPWFQQGSALSDLCILPAKRPHYDDPGDQPSNNSTVSQQKLELRVEERLQLRRQALKVMNSSESDEFVATTGVC